MKRVFLIVLDSCGIGQMPDCEKFGDIGVNTLRSCSTSRKFFIPNLLKAGIGSIDGVDYLPKAEQPQGAYARLTEASMGKDTTIGHWEIAGVVSPEPLPTFPDGFPQEVLAEFEKQTGRGVLCNKPYSGTDVIRDYGEEQLKTGKWIVYTSADSVFQVAAHEDLIPLEELYDACRKARKILRGPGHCAALCGHCRGGLHQNRQPARLLPGAPCENPAGRSKGCRAGGAGRG